MKKTLIIGAPTANRAWVIREWLNYLHAAILGLDDKYRIGIVFAADQKDESVPLTAQFCKAMGYDFDLVAIEEGLSGLRKVGTHLGSPFAPNRKEGGGLVWQDWGNNKGAQHFQSELLQTRMWS